MIERINRARANLLRIFEGFQVKHQEVPQNQFAEIISKTIEAFSTPESNLHLGKSVYFNGLRFGRIEKIVERSHRPDEHYFVYFCEISDPADLRNTIGFEVDKAAILGYERRIINGEQVTNPRDVTLEEAENMMRLLATKTK